MPFSEIIDDVRDAMCGVGVKGHCRSFPLLVMFAQNAINISVRRGNLVQGA